MVDRVLITNDNGIEVPGPHGARTTAAELAREVWVVA